MNKLQAEIQVSEDGYIDYLQFIIDGNRIDRILDKYYPDNFYEGLVPTVSSWMENNKERDVVWTRILPKVNDSEMAPILMCPDDCDFSCTIIVAEIENKGNQIIWKRLGVDKTKNDYNEPNDIGKNVDWFKKIDCFEFDIDEYKSVLNKFENQMILEDIDCKIKFWIKQLAENESIPRKIKALNFGLFETEYDYQIYLTGAKKYSDDNDDWACEIDFEPANKYLSFGKQSKKQKWTSILERTRQTLKAELDRNNLFSNIKNITAGFDGGDLIKIR